MKTPRKTLISLMIGLSMSIPSAWAADPFEVALQAIEDRKAVFATVETADVTVARARIGGTVAELMVDEGAQVDAAQLLARVIDAKLDQQDRAMAERLNALLSQRKLARTALERARKLRASGTLSQARLDEAETAVEVVEREGAVRAPTGGRVLRVRVTEGAVIMPGEPFAEIAARAYLLRLRLPERHARSLQAGDAIRTAEAPTRAGTITQVYPELERGRVVADATLEGLGGFFVGERVSVLVSVGTRQAIVVPGDYPGFLTRGLPVVFAGTGL